MEVEEDRGRWMAMAVFGLAVICVGLYIALKPSYHTRLDTNSTKLFNDTVLSPGAGGSRISYLNYTSPTTYSVPGTIQSIIVSGDAEEKDGRSFSLTIVNKDNFDTFMLGQPYSAYFEKRLTLGKTHFNFSIVDFIMLQEPFGIYFVAGNHYYSQKTILEVQLKNVTLTWTYNVITEVYYPGASLGALLIILGSVLVIFGIIKRSKQVKRR
jgi:hypothetical protein